MKNSVTNKSVASLLCCSLLCGVSVNAYATDDSSANAYNQATDLDRTRLFADFGAGLPKGDTAFSAAIPDLTLLSAKVTGLNSCNGNVGLSVVNAFTDGTLQKIWSKFTTVLKKLASPGGAIYLTSVYISKSNPEVYGLITNGFSIGVKDFLSALGSCESMAKAIVNRADPLIQAQQQTKLNALIEQNAKSASEWSKVDLTTYMKTGLDEAVDAGVTWFGGKRGGADQDPVELVHDSLKYGYCVLRGWTVDQCTSAFSNDGKISDIEERDKQLYSSISDITSAGQTILGDEYLSVCNQCESVKVDGHGLVDYLNNIQLSIYEIIQNLAEKKITSITADEYLTVGFNPDIQVNASYFNALALVSNDTNLWKHYAYGWAYDVAYQRSITMVDRLIQMIKQAKKTEEASDSGLTPEMQELIQELRTQRSTLIDNAQSRGYHPKKYINMLLSLPERKSSSASVQRPGV
ncbi:hypothetical protein [Vibrio tritonius]|uniref:hypothetical protein n=1 Tax=Vibrio tritonius TaxID=1435069 RepID=UPI00315CD82D